jgi:hypothetical protein
MTPTSEVHRPVRGASAVAVLFAALVITGCASKPHDAIDTGSGASSSSSQSGQASNGQQMKASTDDNHSWGDAVQAPLEDLNLKREAIPQILADAIQKPYDLTGLDHCEAIAAEVGKLDALLGKDFDEPPPPKATTSMTQKGETTANDAAVGAVRGAARSIIPFRGLVRQVTGADKHQKQVDTAIQAGKVRRAYLKGVGMNKNCAPPAAPSWFKPRIYVDTYVQDESDPRSSRKHN